MSPYWSQPLPRGSSSCPCRVVGSYPGEEGGAQCWLWNKAQQLLTTAGKSSGPGPSTGREKRQAEKSPLALLCHHSLLTAAGASGPRAPLQERVGAGWLVHLSPHAANCSNPRVPGHRPCCPTPQPFTQFLGKSGVRVEGLEQRSMGQAGLAWSLGCPRDPGGGRWAGLSGNGV